MTKIEQRLEEALAARANQLDDSMLRSEQPPSAAAEELPGYGHPSRGRWIWPGIAAAAVVALVVSVSVLPHGGGTTQPQPGRTTVTETKTIPQREQTGLPRGVEDRHYDVGEILATDDLYGATPYKMGRFEVYWHRFALFSESDSQVARHGITIAAHTDSNVKSLSHEIYVAPVASRVRYVLNECATISTLRTTQVTRARFFSQLRSVEFTFDAAGEIIEIQTTGDC